MDREPSTAPEKADFSLALGGPLYQFYLRAGLAKPPFEWLHRRIIAFALVSWLPLVPLTMLNGHFLGGVGIPFLFDVDTHARFLLSLPLLIWAELLVHRRLGTAVEQFVHRGLIAPEDRPQFDAIVAGVWRMRNSVLAEVLVLVLAFTGGYWLWRGQIALHVATWYAVPVEGAMQFTVAGYWYAFVSLPITRFILARWYFRLFIWYVFLWRVSRLRLRLNPLHPDRAGGLGFLGNTVYAFAPVLIAHTVLLAGWIANHLWHEGAKLPAFQLEIASVLTVLMLLVLLPLAFFVFQMEHAKRMAGRELGLLASRYAHEFRQKWLEGQESPKEALLGQRGHPVTGQSGR